MWSGGRLGGEILVRRMVCSHGTTDLGYYDELVHEELSLVFFKGRAAHLTHTRISLGVA